MTTLECIEHDISNGTTYGDYKVAGHSEPYDNKPGVMLQCNRCGKTIRYRYINLKNQYSIPVCSCSGGRRRASNFYGSTIGNWKVIGKYADRDKTSVIKCIICGRDRLVFNKYVINNQLPKECDCQKEERRQAKIVEKLSKEQLKKDAKKAIQIDKYKSLVGKKVHTYRIVQLCEDGLCVNLECEYCGRKAVAQSNKIMNKENPERRIPRCECDRQGQIRFDKLKGKTIFSDIVIGFRYTPKQGKQAYYDTFVKLKCLKCGHTREVNNLQGIERAYKYFEDNRVNNRCSDNVFFYKKCNCAKGQRAEDRVSKYSRFIGKPIDGSRLTITGIWLDGSNILRCSVKCSCGKSKDGVALAPVLYGHTRQCGCLNIENQQSFHRYFSDKFIGKTVNSLVVMDVFSQNTGATLWKCKCLKCGHIEDINPKLVVERNWHIGCGCRPIKGSEFNKKYTSQQLIGKNFGGGDVVNVYVNEHGSTCLTMVCPECGREYSRQAYFAKNKQIGHCGCLNMQWGEHAVYSVLKEFGINFTPEAYIDGLVGEQGRKLRVDFLLQHGNLSAAIEFDGVQHDQADKYTFKCGDYLEESPDERFMRQRRNDDIKDRFFACKKIPLLRVKAQQVNYSFDKVREQVTNFLVGIGILSDTKQDNIAKENKQ